MSKNITYYEKQHGVIASDRKKYPEDLELTQAEWDKIWEEDWRDFTGVNYEDRIKFLEENGYEVNHANMINPELSHRPVKKKK